VRGENMMWEKILSIILIFNMAFALILTAYASEQELPQTEIPTELYTQTEKDFTESIVEEDTYIKTETQKKEDISSSTMTVEETETNESIIAETEITTETLKQGETEEVAETETMTETEITTETLKQDETEEVAETETITETEITTETLKQDETEEVAETENITEIETENETVTETETEIEKTTDNRQESDSVVYSVDFPSDDGFRFILDPYGLMGLPEGKSASLEELEPYAGKIYCNRKMMVTNRSSVPIKVKVCIQLTGDIHAVESVEDMESDTENNVFLYIIPSKNDLKGNVDNFCRSDIEIVVKKDEPTILEFVLSGNQYLYDEMESGTAVYRIADGEEGHSAAFEITGLINTKANWKKFDVDGKKIGLKISYSYRKV